MMELPDKNTQLFINLHSEDNIKDVALKAGKIKDIDVEYAIRQISGRQKVKTKIPEFYSNENLIYPPGLSLEQSSSSQTAKYKSGLFKGKHLIDLTGGFGVDFAFMSASFEKSTYIEKNPILCEIANHNFQHIAINKFHVYNADCKYINKDLSTADLIYIDPHRRDNLGKKKVFIAECEPNVIEMMDELFRISPKILIKLSPMLDITQAILDLKYVVEVHVIAVENECKEILFILSKDVPEDIRIRTINFKKDNIQHFDFNYKSEENLQIEYSDDVLPYIYEPNAAIMKSGAFKSVAKQFSLKKFHPNSHIYTSSERIINFPGRVFQLKRELNELKINIKQLKKEIPKANISLRNYKMTVESFRKKSAIEDGGNVYIFGFQAINNKFKLIETEQIFF